MASDPKPTLVVFLGGLGDSPVERLVGGARWAATRDSVDAALGCGAYERAVLVGDAEGVIPESPGLTIDADAGEFHFGRRLAGVIRRHSLSRIVYIGGGSVPLFAAQDFALLAETVAAGRSLTNNRYSSDIIGWTVDEDRLRLIQQAERDNSLAPLFAEEGGLDIEELPRSAESLFDIDTPNDLAVLKLAGAGGPHLREYAASAEVDTAAYEQTMPLFLGREHQIIVAGRVGNHTWRYLETETACRVRLFAEERGMEADGRAEAGTVRSLLGYYLESAGTERFFQSLAELGDAAFIDTRVLAAHAGARPSRQDRFLSDLGRAEQISDPFLQDLTMAAARAPIPVLLGGHSLMSGALMLLNETAWRLRDEGRL